MTESQIPEELSWEEILKSRKLILKTLEYAPRGERTAAENAFLAYEVDIIRGLESKRWLGFKATDAVMLTLLATPFLILTNIAMWVLYAQPR